MPRISTTLSLKTPKHSGRATFAIVRREPNGSSKTVKSEALAAINKQFKAGALDYNEALEAARRELKRLKKTLLPQGKKTTLRPANERLFNEYWKAVYSHRTITSPRSARNRLLRALAALGDVPLTADRDELQAQINKSCAGKTSRQRTVVSALNQILKWMGRGDIKLHRTPKTYAVPKHLSLDEWKQVAKHVEEPFRTLFWVMFCTGCRPGEAYGLTTKHRTSVWIAQQMMPDGAPGPTKTRKPRHAAIVPAGNKHLDAWLAMSWEDRSKHRTARHADILTAACKQAFPKQPQKHLVCRDLRHCYAIHLLSRGVSLSLVAQSLGDNILVAQEYYAGFSLGDESLAAVAKLLE